MPEDPVGNPAAAENQVSRDCHEATRGTKDQDEMGTETWDRTRQCALLACGMPEDSDKERRPPERQRPLNACSHQGEKVEGRSFTQQRAPSALSQGQ